MTSNEEKVAIRITELLKDSTLNLDQVGIYVARIKPTYLFSRLGDIVEAADQERDEINERPFHNSFY